MTFRSIASLALIAGSLVGVPAVALAQSPAPAMAPAAPKMAKTSGILKTVVSGVATLESGEKVYFDSATTYSPRKPNMTDFITIYGTRGADGVIQAKKVVIGK